MIKALNTNTTVRGVKGLLSLTALPEFNIAKEVVVESMHAVFSRAIKQHTRILLTIKKKSFSVGKSSQIKLIAF